LRTKSILIVGNGSVGMMIAIKVAMANSTHLVSVIGDNLRTHSASNAAGAMINVYGEIESLPPIQEKLANKLLDLGKNSTHKWRSFLNYTQGDSVITAQDTLVVLKKDAFEFESLNFEVMANKATVDGVGTLESPKVLEYLTGNLYRNFDSVLRIRGEFAVDSHALMKHLDYLADGLRINRVNKLVKRIDANNNRVEFSDGSYEKGDLIVVAAGAKSRSLFDEDLGILEMFQGIGTALVAKNVPPQFHPKEVIRTVNRGGSQCGLHLLPLLNHSTYIGAGNNVTTIKDPHIRFETVSYLFKAVQEEFLGREIGYLLEGEIRVGLRPRSLDGFPMLGPLTNQPSIFIATATNRAGLTWAPEIADFVISWINGISTSSYLDCWLPDRKSLLLERPKDLVKQFISSRIGAGLEHGIVKNSPRAILKAERDLLKVAEQFLNASDSPLVPAGTHPDNWAAAALQNKKK
jgi:glycine/D-amino acid oxidase-like deaminating enzyme